MARRTRHDQTRFRHDDVRIFFRCANSTSGRVDFLRFNAEKSVDPHSSIELVPSAIPKKNGKKCFCFSSTDVDWSISCRNDLQNSSSHGNTTGRNWRKSFKFNHRRSEWTNEEIAAERLDEDKQKGENQKGRNDRIRCERKRCGTSQFDR